IGDGIAWRLLSYDRCAMIEIAKKARKQHINTEGLLQELTELGQAVNENNHVAILNDLTHFMKKGDVTARLDNDNFEFIEVKSSSSKNSRLSRQRKDMEETIAFLNEAERTENGELITIRELPIRPESYIKSFEKLLGAAEKHGMATGKIGE